MAESFLAERWVGGHVPQNTVPVGRKKKSMTYDSWKKVLVKQWSRIKLSKIACNVDNGLHVICKNNKKYIQKKYLILLSWSEENIFHWVFFSTVLMRLLVRNTVRNWRICVACIKFRFNVFNHYFNVFRCLRQLKKRFITRQKDIQCIVT